ncbi:MAG: NAD(P)-dependent alcohol dehydrogenase [Gammaproteobacteria bacterium]|nr:NAD(P)-dependent alcohol dehydrogenase [Gammaproteobacteria bacterium]
MQRLEYDAYGGPEHVHLAEFSLPPPGRREVVVRLAAASINPMDWKLRSGTMKMTTGSRFPRAMGTDLAGTVEAVGADVSRFRPGDEVVGTTSMKAAGAFASMAITSESLLVKKPPALSFAEAATLPIAGVTALLALVQKAHLKAGQRLFLNGATGGVGLAACAIARHIGAEVAGSAGPRSIAFAQELGISPVLDYTTSFPSSLDNTCDVVFDCHGSLSPEQARRITKPGGFVIDIVPTPAKFLRSFISSWYKVLISDPKSENLQKVVDLAAARKLVIPIAKTISLAEAPSVLAALETGSRVFGKVIIAF